MNSKPYELKIVPKLDRWFKKLPDIGTAMALLELIEDELSTNPHPRPEKPKLIRPIKGLYATNPKCLRLKVIKDTGKDIYDEYRFYYTIVSPHLNPEVYQGYVVLLEVSGPSDKDKKTAVESLKLIKGAKFIELKEVLGIE